MPTCIGNEKPPSSFLVILCRTCYTQLVIAVTDIERMSVAERLQTMELLWNSISRSADSLESPSWHQDVLAARSAKVAAGQGRFLSASELRSRLNPPHP